ncbi:type I toxin-antitoxin system SymE family toxin (plasmid) [Chryseobacterium panacisoli]|uniref:Type I toxin-antitoxin system SymE family toxin n=1 Tax=Chryseobacterium panacisoli TaxID=1807141 RepID=A0A5D8ZWD5_9FLAO|nr:SymE family type I addiction module toxin [Chryseobacterium panacisoli]TZF98686.1 type I toxin-antitoxin system SymE family toxin [Chryseobacterium panacisoli]
MKRKRRMNSSKYNELHNRNLTVFLKSFSRAYGKIVYFPEIRTAGKWVQQCGFQAGDKILVSVSKNQIILEREVNYEGSV